MALQQELLKHLLNSNLQEFERLVNDSTEEELNHKYDHLPHKGTLLEIACKREGTQKYINLLLQNLSPNVNKTPSQPIHFAAQKGNFEALEALLKDARIFVNAVNELGHTALHVAVLNYKDDEEDNYDKCIRLLLSHPDLGINTPNNRGYTALQEAAVSECKRAIQTILRYGKHDIDVDWCGQYGMTARELISQKYPELVEHLPQPTDSNIPQNKLLKALEKGNVEVFCNLLRLKEKCGTAVIDPNYWYGKPYKTTILGMACKEGVSEQFVQISLDAGSDPNKVNGSEEKSPIHIAAENGNQNALKVLLRNKSTDINAIDILGKTALHYAVNSVSSSDESVDCLSVLLTNEHLDVFLNLDVLIADRGQTFRQIITEKYPNLITKLPPFAGKTENIETLLFQYLRRKDVFNFISAVKRYQVGENFEKISASLLQYSCQNGLTRFVEALLLEVKVKPNSITDDNKTPPVVLACDNKYYDIVALFLGLPAEDGFDVNAQDLQGNTALHCAVRNENLQTTISLINSGADTNIENKLGKPPFTRESLENLLNECIREDGTSRSAEDYTIIFDYRLLTAHSSRKHQFQSNNCCVNFLNHSYNSIADNTECNVGLKVEMNLLHLMSSSKDLRELLEHPVAYTLLKLKSHKLWYFSIVNLILYLIFQVSLYGYIISVHGPSGHANGTNDSFKGNLVNSDSATSTITFILCTVSLVLLSIRELFQLTMSSRNYISSYENIIDMLIIISAVITLSLSDFFHSSWWKFFTVLTILLSAMKLLLRFSHCPKFYTSFLIFTVVLKRYLVLGGFYSFLLIAYAMSFHVLFNEVGEGEGSEWFPTAPLSILKTFMMMTGEFSIGETTFSRAPFVASLVFILFVILIPIVLFNLLVGIAVDDTQTILKDAALLLLVSRVEIAAEMENIVNNLRNCLERIGCSCYLCGISLCKVNLFEPNDDMMEGSIKPNSSNCITLSSNEARFELERMYLEKSESIIMYKISKDIRNKSKLNLLEESLLQEIHKIIQNFSTRVSSALSRP